MALNTLPAPAGGFRLAPVEPRHAPLFCFALLTVSCALASFALACATPFGAFAVVAAAMLPLRPALLVVTGGLAGQPSDRLRRAPLPDRRQYDPVGFCDRRGRTCRNRGVYRRAARFAAEPDAARPRSHPGLRLWRL